jgi:hypothetical protein
MEIATLEEISDSDDRRTRWTRFVGALRKGDVARNPEGEAHLWVAL